MNHFSLQRGFTLLEILIAVAIFSLVSTATFSMLQQTIRASKVFDDKANYLVELQRLKRLLEQDFIQVVPRAIRDEYGDVLPAVMSENMRGSAAIELSRTGRANPLAKPRSDLLRLRYFFDGDKLVRRTWQQLDRAPQAKYLDQIMLDNVQSWQVRFLSNGQWLESWPAELNSSKTELPNAFEVKLVLSNERVFRWLFSVFPRIQVQQP